MTQPLNFDNYTFRCSSLGKIMGELSESNSEKYQSLCDEIAKLEALQLKAKNTTSATFENRTKKIVKLVEKRSKLEPCKDDTEPQLPQTCISYLIEIYVSVRNGIKKDIHSKYFEKGIACEDEAIELLGELHDRPYNKCLLPRMRNEFIEGECDIRFIEEQLRIVLDMKNAWNAFTFENRVNSNIDSDYEWQGEGYLELYDCDIFILVFGLVNMPQNLIDDEIKRMLFQYGSNMSDSPEYMDAVAEFRKQCTFDHLPLRERFFEFTVTRSRERYAEIVERVKLCRTWLNNYAKKRYIYTHGKLPDGYIEPVKPLREVALVEHEKGAEFVVSTAVISQQQVIEKLQLQNIPPHIHVLDSNFVDSTLVLKSDEIVYEPLHVVESTITVIEKETPFPEVLDTIKPENTIQYENVSEQNGGLLSELDIAKQTIAKMSTVDEIRIFRKTDPLFVKYPELDQITRDRKTEIEKPVAAPVPIATQKPAQKPAKTTPVPVSVPEPIIDETTTKEIERIWTLAKSQTTYEDFIANVSKPNAQFIIKNKDFCLELQKFGIQLKNQIK